METQALLALIDGGQFDLLNEQHRIAVCNLQAKLTALLEQGQVYWATSKYRPHSVELIRVIHTDKGKLEVEIFGAEGSGSLTEWKLLTRVPNHVVKVETL
jgi:hypothetical protein